MDISEFTGLPELPHNLSWSVVKQHNPRTTTRNVFDRNGFSYVSFPSDAPKTDIAIKIVHIREVKREYEVYNNPLLFWKKRRYATDIYEVEDLIYYYSHEELTMATITPELLLKHATIAKAAWEQSIRARKLLGNYPPKKLEIEND